MKERLSTVGPKGQVTIPQEIRQRLGIKPGDKITFLLENGQVRITPARSVVDATFQAFPALERDLSWKQMTEIAHEEQAKEADEEGR